MIFSVQLSLLFLLLKARMPVPGGTSHYSVPLKRFIILKTGQGKGVGQDEMILECFL